MAWNLRCVFVCAYYRLQIRAVCPVCMLPRLLVCQYDSFSKAPAVYRRHVPACPYIYSVPPYSVSTSLVLGYTPFSRGMSRHERHWVCLAPHVRPVCTICLNPLPLRPLVLAQSGASCLYTQASYPFTSGLTSIDFPDLDGSKKCNYNTVPPVGFKLRVVVWLGVFAHLCWLCCVCRYPWPGISVCMSVSL